ncbi:hypothetical protein BOCO_0986 [Bombiscardovia coagulans]|uniref:Uncharacterized protein n=1 Tax=Bombiscardovia coagulans TaxID=686666 RepID=A0A261EQP5_9BIFI|nr:hypothetical protein BOCO_0986 [Bombiscardovia coagulans]
MLDAVSHETIFERTSKVIDLSTILCPCQTYPHMASVSDFLGKR